MLVDSYIVPECIVRPGSFGALMALYESNYLKLAFLVETFDADAASMLSVVPGDERLSLAIESASKYTRSLRLTYLFEEHDSVVAQPNLLLRVYLDARMVEVRGWADYQRHRVLRELDRQFKSELDRRWSENMMLSKWLDYLVDCGHSFSAQTPAGAEGSAEIQA